MATIPNINNNIVGMITTRPNAQNVQTVDVKIARIDKEINIREKYVETLDNHIKLTKENINLRKEYIQTVKESKELGEKRISLLQDTNNKLQALLNRNSNKIDVSDVKLLDKQLDTFTKKENVLKAQANVVDTKIEKLASKVDFVEKQITKLEAKSNDIDNSSLQSKPDKNSFAAGYRPTADQIAKLELSKIQLETHDLDSSDTLFQQRVYYSQKNIYESILNSLLLKVFV
jgi:chromosome segregation ATPase